MRSSKLARDTRHHDHGQGRRQEREAGDPRREAQDLLHIAGEKTPPRAGWQEADEDHDEGERDGTVPCHPRVDERSGVTRTSQTSQTTAITTPDPIAPSTVGDVSPSAPACMKPSMRVATARNRSTAPTMSSFEVSAGISRLGRSRRAHWTERDDRGDHPRHEHPGPPGALHEQAGDDRPEGGDAHRDGERLARRGATLGRWEDVHEEGRPRRHEQRGPDPAMNRATNSSVDEPIRPDATVSPAAARKMSRPALNMGTRPFRSPSHPPRVTNPASERNARCTTHRLAVIEIPRLAWIDDRATVAPAVSEGPRGQGRSGGDQGERAAPGKARPSWAGAGWGWGGRHASISLSGLAVRTGGATQVPSRISTRGR